MPDYFVHSMVEQVYKINADTPEQAAELVEGGESDQTPETIGAYVDRVTVDGDFAGPDLREPGYCETHKTTIRPGHDCVQCILAIPRARKRA